MRIDSSRWTNLPSGWKAELGRATLPPDLARARARPLYSAEQRRAIGHAVLLILSPLLGGLAALLIGLSTTDLLVEAPPATAAWPLASLAGFALWFAAERDFWPRLCRWLACAGWIAVALSALGYAAIGLSARAAAVVGPELRAQVSARTSHGSGRNRSTASTLALSDGTTVSTGDWPRGDRRCLSVRRVQGSRGFAWLRVTGSMPPPGPGQLAWPVSRAECFSAVELSTLGR